MRRAALKSECHLCEVGRQHSNHLFFGKSRAANFCATVIRPSERIVKHPAGGGGVGVGDGVGDGAGVGVGFGVGDAAISTAVQASPLSFKSR